MHLGQLLKTIERKKIPIMVQFKLGKKIDITFIDDWYFLCA